MNAQANPTTALSIFLSCRKEDESAAVAIRDQLLFNGKDRVHVAVSGVSPKGLDYRAKTLQDIAVAHKLILLYTDPHQEWDACFYESGFFDGRIFPDSKRRLIVLHDEECVPPDPLGHLQAVKISRKDMEPLRQFLREIFAEEPSPGVEPINPDLMEPRFDHNRKILEDAIIDAIIGSQEKFEVYAKEIRVVIPFEALQNKDGMALTKEDVSKATGDDELPEVARIFADREL
jgi:hypothetical protein